MQETGIFTGSIFSGMGDDVAPPAAPDMTAVTTLRPTNISQFFSGATPAPAGMGLLTKVAIGVAGIGVLGAVGWFIWKRRQVKANRRRRR